MHKHTHMHSYTPTHSQSTQEPLPMADVNELWEDCKNNGALIGKGGIYGNVCKPYKYHKGGMYMTIIHRRACTARITVVSCVCYYAKDYAPRCFHYDSTNTIASFLSRYSVSNPQCASLRKMFVSQLVL